MSKLIVTLASAILFNRAIANDNDWVYTPETHTTCAPATAEGALAGIDARVRGSAENVLDVLDRWYKTAAWICGDVNFGAAFFVITIR